MGQKKKEKDGASRKRRGPAPLLWGFVLICVPVLLVAGYVLLTPGSDVKASVPVPPGGETRRVINPGNFMGEAGVAYAAAMSFPKVMDQVYCYCQCDRPPFLHKSLLSCFATTHGAS